MSALDQAFIKAFAKEPVVTSRTAPRDLRIAPSTAPVEPPQFDELYDAGSFYRVDSAAADRAVPDMHVAPDRKLPRRLQRRGAVRQEIDLTVPMVPEPVVEASPQPLPPRRNWSRSMLEIARQLAQLDLLKRESDGTIPEVVPFDPPELEASAPRPKDAKSLEANTPVETSIELPLSAPQSIAQLWSVNAEIMAQSVVSLADAETWLALPMAPAVACHENLADGWSHSVAEQAPAVAEEAEEEKEADESSKLNSSEPVVSVPVTPELPSKSHRKFRVDASHPRIPRPHQKPDIKVIAEEELPAEAENTEAVPVAEAVPVSEPRVAKESVAVEPSVVTPTPVAEKTRTVESAPPPPPVTVPKRPYVPLWEVDRFTWPALCDKLMHDPNGYFASASNKLLSVVHGGLKVLGITGSRRGEGRTTLALCLARAAAQAGIHVALVDADFARPQLASMLGLETAYGWQEAATGKIPLSEAAVKSLADRLTVLPLEVSTTDAPLSLADPRVTATLRATAATFDLVIIDLGPLSSSAESLFPPGENCPLDAAIVVRDTRYASVNESRLAGERLYDAGIEAVGIAENFVSQPELAFL